MITSTKFLKRYCKNYKNIENYQEALKSPLRFDLHHRREISESKSASDLIAENLYYDRPATELIFLEHREHISLHNKCKFVSTDTRQKLSDAHKGRLVSEDTRKKISEAQKGEKSYMYGKHLSAETKQKMSDAKKGRHWHLENGRRVYTD
jgi:hypothetical protein